MGGAIHLVVLCWTGVEDAPAALARERADVDDPVGLGDDVHVVLDDDDGVSGAD